MKYPRLRRVSGGAFLVICSEHLATIAGLPAASDRESDVGAERFRRAD
jgi:hypothetical protein